MSQSSPTAHGDTTEPPPAPTTEQADTRPTGTEHPVGEDQARRNDEDELPG